LSHQHVAYRSSRLTRPDGSSTGLRPGDRAPDVEVTVPGGGANRLHSVLRGTRHVLLVSRRIDLSAVEWECLQPFRDLFAVAVGDFSGGGRSASVHLVRPDGYLAARGALHRMDAIVDYLEQLAGGQARQPDRAEVPRLERLQRQR
jgi:aromatic ring hydroxylase-like protein